MTPCREWQGPFTNGGYGQRNSKLMHRWVWEQINGPIPKGKVIMHKCHNRPCYRYDHLQLGTYSENTLQAAALGRMKRNLGGFKITPDQALEIFHSTERQKPLALRYGVSQVTISDIRCGRTWSHVTHTTRRK